jgi:hypothetical protein
LHQTLVTTLAQMMDPNPSAQTTRDPTGLLTDSHTHEIQTLIMEN